MDKELRLVPLKSSMIPSIHSGSLQSKQLLLLKKTKNSLLKYMMLTMVLIWVISRSKITLDRTILACIRLSLPKTKLCVNHWRRLEKLIVEKSSWQQRKRKMAGAKSPALLMFQRIALSQILFSLPSARVMNPKEISRFSTKVSVENTALTMDSTGQRSILIRIPWLTLITIVKFSSNFTSITVVETIKWSVLALSYTKNLLQPEI